MANIITAIRIVCSIREIQLVTVSETEFIKPTLMLYPKAQDDE